MLQKVVVKGIWSHINKAKTASKWTSILVAVEHTFATRLEVKDVRFNLGITGILYRNGDVKYEILPKGNLIVFVEVL